MSNKIKTTEMKQDKRGLVPKLRFPEFKDAGGWEEKKFSSYAKLYRGSSPRPINEFLTKNDNAVNWIKIGDTKFSSNFVIKKVEEKITKDGAKRSRFVKVGELILANSMSYGKTYQLAIDGCIYDGWFVVREYENFFYKPFLLKLLNSDFMQKQYERLAAGGIVQNISSEIVYNSKLFNTSLSEQQKIANCLSSIDDLITAESEKLESIKNHKKGLMQNLFPPEGKTIPNFRFPEFKGDGEWEKLTLSDVYSFKVTNSFSREKLNYENGLVKNIHYGDIHTKFSTLFDITKESVPFVNLSQEIANIKTDNYCIEGDIILADASEDMNDIGKSIEIVNLNNEKLLSGLHTLLARQKKNRLKVGFGGYLFKSQCIRSQIQKEAQGAKVLGISATRLSNIKIIFPKKKQEQQKIANCLSSIDDLITAQIKKIDMLKKHKKGLMQQIFPSPDDQINHQSK